MSERASAPAVATNAAGSASAAADDTGSAPLAPCGRGAGGEGDERASTVSINSSNNQPSSPFDQLIVDYQQQITRLVHRLLGWSPDIEDVVQDVFVDAFKNLSKFNAASSVQTWLTRIAINRCRSHQRKQWLRRMLPLPLGEVRGESAGKNSQTSNPLLSPLAPCGRGAGGEGSGAASQLERAETHQQVHAAIEQLSQRDRELIVLRYLEEQSIEAISQTLNLKPNVVNVRLNRARARLEIILKPILEQ